MASNSQDIRPDSGAKEKPRHVTTGAADSTGNKTRQQTRAACTPVRRPAPWKKAARNSCLALLRARPPRRKSPRRLPVGADIQIHVMRDLAHVIRSILRHLAMLIKKNSVEMEMDWSWRQYIVSFRGSHSMVLHVISMPIHASSSFKRGVCRFHCDESELTKTGR